MWFFKSGKSGNFEICQCALHIFWNGLENKSYVQNNPLGSMFELYAAKIWFLCFLPMDFWRSVWEMADNENVLAQPIFELEKCSLHENGQPSLVKLGL